MAVSIKQFNGFMDTDDNDEVIPSACHKYAKNGRFRGNGNQVVFENILGNTEIPFNKPSGNNQCIGAIYDPLKQRIISFNYNSNGNNGIYKYDLVTELVTPLLVCGTNSSGDILNFDLDYPIFSIDILYTTDADGDILHWIQRNAESKRLNIKEAEDNKYGSAWLEEYLTVIKVPPIMPPKCVYENDYTVTVNNVRNALFQFSYRFVFTNNEKSVWSSKSIVPLPFQASTTLTYNIYGENSRISVSMNTGGADVFKIEASFRQVKEGVTSDWFLIDSFDKTTLGISDNDIYTIKFYNGGLYDSLLPDETSQLQDYVQRTPNTQALLNGNVLALAGGTEGYDYINANLSVNNQAFNTSSFYYEYNGTLFFATINGIDSGSQGTILKIYLYGTGTNTDGEVVILSNGAAKYSLNVFNSLGVNVGTSYTNATDNPTVVAVLSAISALLVTNGMTEVSRIGNILIMSYPTTLTIHSSGIQTVGTGFSSPTNKATTHFTYPWQSDYELALMYFSDKCRTNGAIISSGSKFTLPVDNTGNNTPQLIITHRPPTWATHYQVLRTNNLTYSYRLDWVTNGAYSDSYNNILGQRYAYLEIDNIYTYNELIKSTEGVIGYTFAPGDRVRILGRFDATGTAATLNSVYDYEVIGIETSFVINGVTKNGVFVKIYYPVGDIDGNFLFDGTSNFLAYRILLYRYAKHSQDASKVYFEFGKRFGIGNAGTSTAYHIGLEQSQTSDLVTPAKITIANGDFFTRSRVVPIGQTYMFTSGRIANGFVYVSTAMTIATTVTNSLYTVQSSLIEQSNALIQGSGTYTSAYCFFLNNTSASLTTRIRCNIPITMDAASATAVLLVAVNSNGTFETTTAVDAISMVSSTSYNIAVDKTIIVKGLARLHLIIQNTSQVVNQQIAPFNIIFDVINNVAIDIVESSFSDVYKLVTNSNGREALVDVDAKQAVNDSLLRWSLPYIQNTNINGSNNFIYENFDEVDRDKGAIQRLKARDRELRVFQNKGVGRYGIYSKYIKNNSGQTELIVTDSILTKNNIQYYKGEYGIGEEYGSLSSSQNADYFVFPITGAFIRVANDGMTNLSELYKGRFYLGGLLDKYNKTWLRVDGSKAKILSYYDFNEEQSMNILQGGTLSGNIINDYAFSFNETRNSPCSFYDLLNPDFMICAENTTYAWKDGRMYIHNNETNYCNFFGTQYYPSIQLVFNEHGLINKNFNSIGYQSNQKWICPEVGDIYTSTIDNQTGVRQQSKLPLWAVEIEDSKRIASILRDVNSMIDKQEALIEGNYLNGFNIVINLVYLGNEYAWIYLPYLTYEPNNRQF